MSGLITQFLSFAGVGAIGTTVHYAVLLFLVEALSVYTVAATTAGFIAGALVNYLLNYYLTFSSNKRHSETAMKFALVALGGMVLNALVMAILNSAIHINYFATQILATCVVLVWNFAINRCWTFRKPGNTRFS